MGFLKKTQSENPDDGLHVEDQGVEVPEGGAPDPVGPVEVGSSIEQRERQSAMASDPGQASGRAKSDAIDFASGADSTPEGLAVISKNMENKEYRDSFREAVDDFARNNQDGPFHNPERLKAAYDLVDAYVVAQEEQPTGTDQAEGLMDGLPSSIYLLREILRNHDWSDNPADPAGQMIERAMIESMIRSAIDDGHRSYVEKVWEEVAPPGHGGLNDILASLTVEGVDPEPAVAPELDVHEPHDEPEGGVEPHLHTYQVPSSDHLPEPFLRAVNPADILDGQFQHIPDEEFSKPYQGQEWASRPERSEAVRPAPSSAANPEGAAVSGGSDLLSKALSAPFALVAAAGSLVMGSIKAMGDQAGSIYQKRAVNGHLIMERQLNDHATRIDGLTSRLRQSGMGEFIAELKATGRPANEIFDGMKPGGPYEKFGRRFSSLMEGADFASNYANLQRHMDEFGDLASRYAKAGIDLNLDYSDAVDRNLSKISAATEGFPGTKDGAFKHMQEMAQQIGERIKRLVDRLMGRLAPQ